MTTEINRFAASTLVGLGAALLATPALAVLPLEGRTLIGAAVSSTDPSAAMEYDPNLNITWLRDWNANGKMTWSTAQSWASTLTVGTFSGWSLPNVNVGDTSCSDHSSVPGYPTYYYGTHCTGSPMGYLYSTEGHTAAAPGPFRNMASNFYWSPTVYAPDPTSGAWGFTTDIGYQGLSGSLTTPLYAVAVRPGDVASVPEPLTLAMMLAGLSAMAAAWRRRPG